jgi:hypothetical protein
MKYKYCKIIVGTVLFCGAIAAPASSIGKRPELLQSTKP